MSRPAENASKPSYGHPRLLLSLAGGSKLYSREDGWALRGASLDVFTGDFIAITGPSGAGKSTLLNILALLDSPDGGEYFVAGQLTSEMRRISIEHIRAKLFGFVFQQSNAIESRSVAKNVEIPLASSRVPVTGRARAVARALRLAHIEHKASSKVSSLSGGERQRMAIARALVNDARVLFLDEPTGNLDSANTQSVIELLTDLNRIGTTIVLVTHDPELASFASRQIRVLDGELTEIAISAPKLAAPEPPYSKPEFRAGTTAVPERRAKGLRVRIRALSDALSEALFTLHAHPLRTVAVLLSIALGAAGLVASINLGLTAQGQIDHLISDASSSNVTVSIAGSGEAGGKRTFDSTDISRIGGLEGVEAVGYQDQVAPADAAISTFPGLPTNSSTISLMGVSSGTFSALGIPIHSRTSRLFDVKTVNLSVALVGENAARTLGIVSGEQQSIWVGGTEFDVLGILSPTPQLPTMADSVVVSHDAVAQLAIPSRDQIVVRTDPGHSFVVAEAIPIALDPANPGHYLTDGAANLLTLRHGVSTSIDGLLLALAFVFLGISILTTSATMTNSVLQRSGEIGLRMATGASPADVAGLFVIEGGLVGFIGGIIGAVIGVIAVIGIALVQRWDPYFNLSSLLLGIVSGVVAGVFASIAPSVRASRIQPAQALRG